ncbi:amylo-alpha-1,6-glucosidase [Robertkochia sediminum]|uniref:amylo-alpha-1,6-glucosidase n=1 Tax=Robertkochia sediminum TaxID=2785326 RepID=UPI00193459C8|nr:glycogen debranching protein [Robertkochia sediminum]MBL7471233.1 glycogen debranching protein [Robertkochia sediminum]
MKRILLLVLIMFFSCNEQQPALHETLGTLEGIPGKETYKHSPYITAGDRFYAIGAQDGSFPEIGWHIDKEMGGLWNHPIKVMDGFEANILEGNNTFPLKDATFINYPIGSTFTYEIPGSNLQVEQFQFAPDQQQGMVVEYILSNEGKTSWSGSLQFQAHTDLRPTWLGERSDMIDAADSLYMIKGENTIIAKDLNNDWYGVVTSSEAIQDFTIEESPYKGKGKSAVMNIPATIDPAGKQVISIYLASSYTSLEEAMTELADIRDNANILLQEKVQSANLLERQSRLTTSDPEFDKVFRWLKYNAQWFIREVPEHGRGIAAGYPDYPWWFGCDSEYALQGYLATGNFEITRATINLLASLSAKSNDNGRIVHEASTNGVVFNPGNVNETPQFASLLWNYYLWTGDVNVLTDHFELIRKGLDWITEEQDRNGNGFPEGSGMMEIHGLDSEMIDVASYTQRGLEDGAKIAEVVGRPDIAAQYKTQAEALKTRINEVFWVDDFNSYADFIANDQQTLKLIEDAIIRADTLNKPWAVKELEETKAYLLKHPSAKERPFVLHHNWVVNTPMEMGIADRDKAQKALETGRQFVNPFGVFVTGIDRDESAGTDIGSFKGSKVFSYTGAVMTLPTGVSAVAENNYGNPDLALDYLKRMGRSFSYALPGSIYEVSPDYGMFAQAWNIYSYAVPVVQQFFGIQPLASKKYIRIQPLMPSDWDFAHLENVKIGANEVSIRYEKTTSGYSLEVSQKRADWELDIQPANGFEIVKEQVENPLYYTLYYRKADRP